MAVVTELYANTPPVSVRKTITFTGAANRGAQGSVPLFNITGSVVVEKIVGNCTADLVSAGGGTLALGVTGATTLFIGATTATAIDTGEIWATTTPTAGGIAIPAACKDIAINANIIGTVATGDITAGAIDILVVYRQLSSDGALVPA